MLYQQPIEQAMNHLARAADIAVRDEAKPSTTYIFPRHDLMRHV